MEPSEKPIGYWPKRVDRLIDGALSPVLADHGLTRRHWQVLNVLGGEGATDAQVDDALRPFWAEGSPARAEVLAGVTGRGWARRHDGGRYRLTREGEAARTAIAARVEEVRDAAARGITEAEYLAAVGTLRRMAENLDPAGR